MKILIYRMVDCRCLYITVYCLLLGDLATVASRQQSIDTDINRSAIEKDKSEDLDIQNGRLSVSVHNCILFIIR